MKLLIHGDDQETSRNLFFEEKPKLLNPIFFEGESIAYEEFFRSLKGTSFFDEKVSVVIENLFSKKTKDLDKILELINNSKDIDLIIYEKNAVAKTFISKLKDFDVREYAYPKIIFSFLDNLIPKNSNYLIKIYNDLRRTQEAEIILFMLIRQFRLMLSQNLKGGKIEEEKRMQSWQSSKILRQSRYFSLERLKDLYGQLYKMDLNQKTGNLPNSLDIHIDFFLLHL